MPIKTGKFTPKERRYIEAAAQVGEGVMAAQIAKYAHPPSAADRLQKNPAVVQEVRKIQEQRLHNDLLPLAVDRIEKILQDDKENARNHIAAAKLVFDHSLKSGENQAKEPHEMSADELQERIARLRQRQHEIAEGAKDITPRDDLEGDVFG